MLTERSFDTGENVLNYAEGGTDGPPLVMLHGSSMNWQSYEEFVPTLAQSWHIYACDLRGHGKSGRAKSGYLFENFVPDTTTFIERQVGEPVVLIGFSLGASIALGVAARLPNLVRALVLLEPALVYFREFGLEAFPEAHEWYVWLNETLTSTHSFDEILARCKERAPELDEAAALSFAQDVTHLDQRSISSTLNNLTFKEYQPELLLPKVICPTLLVRGDLRLGAVINDRDVELFKKLVPQGITVSIQDTGHMLIQGTPGQATLEQVTQYLKSLKEVGMTGSESKS